MIEREKEIETGTGTGTGTAIGNGNGNVRENGTGTGNERGIVSLLVGRNLQHRPPGKTDMIRFVVFYFPLYGNVGVILVTESPSLC